MASTRRSQQTGIVVTAVAGDVAAIGVGVRSRISRTRERAAQSDEEDDDFQAPDVVSACMQYTSEWESKCKTKATKLSGESKKIAAEYAKKTQNEILSQQNQINVAYQEYYKNVKKDDEEREQILSELAKNFEAIEKYAQMMDERYHHLEKLRFDKTNGYLGKAETNRAACASQVANALAAKRKAVHARI